MSPKKLTDEDRQQILKLYRQTPATTSTLAEHYGVSSSTISRFLKTYLSESEYERLIQQKRLGRTPKSESLWLEKTTSRRPAPILTSPAAVSEVSREPVLTPEGREAEPEEGEDLEPVDVLAIGAMLGEDLADLDEEEEDFEEEEGEEWETEAEEKSEDMDSLPPTTDLEVLPLAAASFPNTCYLVIDRAAELITRPLKEFSHLGRIPAGEIQQKTLPIFDNHRVARRFSNRFQRVIKVPDGRLLEKTCSYLRAKGIARILIDGHVYAL